MKKEQTGKRKKYNNTRKRYVYTKRAQNRSGATGMVGGPWAASCSEDRHKGHDCAAATPGSAGSHLFPWTCR